MGPNKQELVSTKGMNKHGKTNLYIRNDKSYDQFLVGSTFAMDSIDVGSKATFHRLLGNLASFFIVNHQLICMFLTVQSADLDTAN
ncbi:hypothetical protein OK016_17325 [Vibrio chagasii]|nr:hypothetical protein [Vibrio chagasii]